MRRRWGREEEVEEVEVCIHQKNHPRSLWGSRRDREVYSVKKLRN